MYPSYSDAFIWSTFSKYSFFQQKYIQTIRSLQGKLFCKKGMHIGICLYRYISRIANTEAAEPSTFLTQVLTTLLSVANSGFSADGQAKPQ